MTLNPTDHPVGTRLLVDDDKRPSEIKVLEWSPSMRFVRICEDNDLVGWVDPNKCLISVIERIA